MCPIVSVWLNKRAWECERAKKNVQTLLLLLFLSSLWCEASGIFDTEQNGFVIVFEMWAYFKFIIDVMVLYIAATTDDLNHFSKNCFDLFHLVLFFFYFFLCRHACRLNWLNFNWKLCFVMIFEFLVSFGTFCFGSRHLRSIHKSKMTNPGTWHRKIRMPKHQLIANQVRAIILSLNSQQKHHFIHTKSIKSRSEFIS